MESYKEGMDMGNLQHIPEISGYNFNYFVGLGNDLLFAKSDDDKTTAWYLILGMTNYQIGISYASEGDLLRVHDNYC